MNEEAKFTSVGALALKSMTVYRLPEKSVVFMIR